MQGDEETAKAVLNAVKSAAETTKKYAEEHDNMSSTGKDWAEATLALAQTYKALGY